MKTGTIVFIDKLDGDSRVDGYTNYLLLRSDEKLPRGLVLAFERAHITPIKIGVATEFTVGWPVGRKVQQSTLNEDIVVISDNPLDADDVNSILKQTMFTGNSEETKLSREQILDAIEVWCGRILQQMEKGA